jgi:superfamily I DNA and/or RNA helicase
LNNSRLWYNSDSTSNRPILMICYTNHALDQFLELCIQNCRVTKVVRVGGRCKNPKLENFLIRNIKEKRREKKETENFILHPIRKLRNKIKEIQDRLNEQLSYIELSQQGVLKLKSLRRYMGEFYYNQFDESEFNFLKWLGFLSVDKIESNKKYSKDQNASKNENNEYNVFDTNEETENENENEERMLDEDFFIHSNNNEYNLLEIRNEIIFEENELDWICYETKSNNERTQSYFKKVINNQESMEILADSLETLKQEERIGLYSFWVSKYREDYNNEIENIKKFYNRKSNELNELKMQEDRIIMQNALIIAMTCTGAARYYKLLQDIGPKIVIVEEAAEVFETHIVTSLSKQCEHLILIGDHAQLKPKCTSDKLAKKYHLDVSLFERLLNNKLKHVTLSCQHRMKPEISILMKLFYNTEIRDHESCSNRPNIRGIKQNISFISHNNFEENCDEGKSKINKFEANYLISLAKYLIKQDYKPKQITILTTYLGQMFLIRNQSKKENLEDVIISTVDNYQGEENDIVLLSLVRSNEEGRIGFLGIENRICVAFSRARNGFYCIGNFNIFNRVKNKWKAIIETMNKRNCLNAGLSLYCVNHKNNQLIAENPTDFDKRPEGGCQMLCDTRLNCGHVCRLICHSYDRPHQNIKCFKECGKKLPCGHDCKEKCSHIDECLKYSCKEKVLKKLKCDHEVELKCHENIENFKCQQKCERILKCGHPCLLRCFKPCESCNTKLEVTLPCTHKSTINIECKRLTEAWILQEKCDEKCNFELDCGHLCQAKCGSCYAGRIHLPCVNDRCNRILVCGHQCRTPCAKECRPCIRKCENRCKHSKCNQLCSNQCIPCKEQCDWKCKHKVCTKLCYELCDRDPCNMPCTKKLKCNHNCVGFCGEPCPPLCKICHKEKLTEILFGNEEDENAKFVYLEDCRHVIESAGMDNWIKSQCSNNLSDSESNNQEDKVIKLPECPKCKTPIRLNLRYSSYIKAQIDLIERVKIMYTGTKEETLVYKTAFLDFIERNQKNEGINEKFKDELHEIAKFVKNKNRHFTIIEIKELRTKWKLYFSLIDIEVENKNSLNESSNKNCMNYEIKKLKEIIYKIKNSEEYCTKNPSKSFRQNQPFSKQYQNDLSYEIERIKKLFQYFRYHEYIYKSNNRQNTNDAITVIMQLHYLLIAKIEPYVKIENKVNDLFNQIATCLGVTFNINFNDRVMILKAMNLKQGHWYKCKNGHIYAITECGGAMLISKCPDCDAIIGGQNHRLESDNMVATEMDGAKHGAWSEQANLENFDLQDLH